MTTFIIENWKDLCGTFGLIISFFAGKKMNSIKEKQADSDALSGIQVVYDKFVEQTNKKFDEMEQEIKVVKSELNQYKQQCSHCSNNKLD
jgi:cell shape-determining protein MreC